MCSDCLLLYPASPSGCEGCEELDGVVYDLNSTEDGEACEEPHGPADEAELGLQGHLHIPLYLVVGRRVKVDLDQLQGSKVYFGTWNKTIICRFCILKDLCSYIDL